MKSFLGEYVKTSKHGHRGRVIAVHHTIHNAHANEDWVEAQAIKVTKEELKGRWYSILCVDGGSVLVSENDIVEKENPYPLNNVWESDYFNQVAV